MVAVQHANLISHQVMFVKQYYSESCMTRVKLYALASRLLGSLLALEKKHSFKGNAALTVQDEHARAQPTS